MCILHSLASGVTSEYTDFSMAAWEHIQQPWIGGGDIEMTAVALRKVKRVLLDGGVVYLRGSLGGVERYASVIQGPGEHEKTSIEGTVLSVSIDLATIIEGELQLGPLASAIERSRKLFVSRAGLVHEEFPTVFAFQFPSPPLLRRAGSSDSLPSGVIDSPAASVTHPSPAATPVLTFWMKLLAPLYWLRNYTWWGFVHDARHTPAVILIGKAWAWTWAIPYVQIPLGVLTSLWSIQVLNVTWSAVWSGVIIVAGGAATWIFTIVDDFFDHSVYFRLVCVIAGLYLFMMCAGAVGLTLVRGLMWSIKRLRRAWSFDSPIQSVARDGPVVVPVVTKVVDGGVSVIESQLPPLVKTMFPSFKPVDSELTDSVLSSPDSKGLADLEEAPPSDSASRIALKKDLDLSPVDSSGSIPPTSIMVCQAHLVKLHPHLSTLIDSPCFGKRVRQVRLLSCDKLRRGSEVAKAVDGAGVLAILCGKHREGYMAHRDFHKCARRDCYELGIELIIDSINIRECRDHLQKRLLTGNPSVIDPLRQRSSTIASNRVDSVQEDAEVSTPEFSTKVPLYQPDELISSSSSDLAMPELVVSGEDDCLSAQSSLPTIPSVCQSSTFAQNVRSELESLAEKSIAADASLWDKQSNQELVRVAAAAQEAVPSVTKSFNQVDESAQGHQTLSAGRIISQEPKRSPESDIVSGQAVAFPLIPSGVNSPASIRVSTPGSSAIPVAGLLPCEPTCAIRQPVIGQAVCQMPGQSPTSVIVNITPSLRLDDLAGVEQLMPQFVRRRSAPSAHQVITDEVDAEMYESRAGEVSDLRELASLVKAEKEDSKDEPWARLNELSTFSLCGFGQLDAKLAIGVYNKERKATLQRQGLTEGDRLWDRGIRVPIGTRLAHSSATLHWGALSSEGTSDDALLVSDFLPWAQDSYGRYQPDGKKNETRRKQALIIEKFAKAGKQHTLMFSLLYGKEHYKKRCECLLELGRLREARPELSTVDFATETFEEMNFHYIAQIREGARKVTRLGADRVKKPDFARLALNVADGKSPRWEYPTTFLMRHPAGLWLARIIPKLEEKVSKAAWTSVLEPSKVNEKDREAGSAPPLGEVSTKRMYPSGRPLRVEEQELSKQHRPKSMTSGDYLCWDYSSHAGCTDKNENCSKGKHELMSVHGLHGSILMQLARRGGHRSGRRLKPEEIDGYNQAIRDSMMLRDVSKKVPPAGAVKSLHYVPKVPAKELAKAPPYFPKVSPKATKTVNIQLKDDKKGKEIPVWKSTDTTKLVWKPKARASGVPFVPPPPTLLGQGIVHKFGSDRRSSSVEAAKSAEQRALTMHSEVYPQETGQTDEHLLKIDPTLELEHFLKNPAESLLTHDCELSQLRRGSAIWDKSVLPLDFSMADFSDLEEKTRTLYQIDDSWVYQDDVNPVLLTEPLDLRPREEQLQFWRDAYQPVMSDRIIPFVRHAMVNNKDPLISFDEACILSLDHLSEGGALADQACAKQALEVFKIKEAGRVGKERAVSVVFSHVMRCADYIAQNVSIGALHFTAVDMGGRCDADLSNATSLRIRE